MVFNMDSLPRTNWTQQHINKKKLSLPQPKQGAITCNLKNTSSYPAFAFFDPPRYVNLNDLYISSPLRCLPASSLGSTSSRAWPRKDIWRPQEKTMSRGATNKLFGRYQVSTVVRWYHFDLGSCCKLSIVANLWYLRTQSIYSSIEGVSQT